LQEDFLKDVMQFLVQRGHNKLVPQGGLSEFPDAILNAKRLDLYNLYKEVIVSSFLIVFLKLYGMLHLKFLRIYPESK
jgi:hypothetical protein